MSSVYEKLLEKEKATLAKLPNSTAHTYQQTLINHLDTVVKYETYRNSSITQAIKDIPANLEMAKLFGLLGANEEAKEAK